MEPILFPVALSPACAMGWGKRVGGLMQAYHGSISKVFTTATSFLTCQETACSMLTCCLDDEGSEAVSQQMRGQVTSGRDSEEAIIAVRCRLRRCSTRQTKWQLRPSLTSGSLQHSCWRAAFLISISSCWQDPQKILSIKPWCLEQAMPLVKVSSFW